MKSDRISDHQKGIGSLCFTVQSRSVYLYFVYKDNQIKKTTKKKQICHHFSHFLRNLWLFKPIAMERNKLKSNYNECLSALDSSL